MTHVHEALGMADMEDMSKQVDLIYKNLLEKFNPNARQVISAGKAYLKALHGAVTSSKAYFVALNKLARQTQTNPGQSSDVGSSLVEMVEVYREIQSQQMNTLRAFYIDLLVPLENNLEKDSKVLQAEQKRFLACQRQQLESLSKASSLIKKRRKSNKDIPEKDIKQIQQLDEEKKKLDAFIQRSFQIAMAQERRRYGFVLERQCSLARHFLAYHMKGSTLLQRHLDSWNELAKKRDILPNQIRSIDGVDISVNGNGDDIYAVPVTSDDDRLRNTSQTRRAQSADPYSPHLEDDHSLSRTRSEFEIDHVNDTIPYDPHLPRHSMAVADSGKREMVRALYSYEGTTDNQMSFIEGDIMALIGEKSKGWQYGENLRTNKLGWFPLSYTKFFVSEDDSALGSSGIPPLSMCYSRSKRSQSLDDTLKDKADIAEEDVPVFPKVRTPRPSIPNALYSPAIPQSCTNFRPTPPLANPSPVNSCFERETAEFIINSSRNLDKRKPFVPSRYKFRKSYAKKKSLEFPANYFSESTPEEGDLHDSKNSRRFSSFHSSEDSGFSNEDSYRRQSETGILNDSNNRSCKPFSDLDLPCCPDVTWHAFSCPVHDKLLSSTMSLPSRNPQRYSSCPKFTEYSGTLERKKPCKRRPALKDICLQDITNIESSRKIGRRSLSRSASLLCLGIASCRGLRQELAGPDYEGLQSGDWHHVSLVDVMCGDIPSPPSYDAPPPPSMHPEYSFRPPMPLPSQAPKDSNELHNSEFSLQNSSSGNSTLRESEESSSSNNSIDGGGDIYMVVEDHMREVAQSAPKSCSRSGKLLKRNGKALRNDSCGDKRREDNFRDQRPLDEPPPLPKRRHRGEKNEETPPLPPRTYSLKTSPTQKSFVNCEVNIFTYGEFLSKRLKCPEGISQIDLESYTTGNKCGPWYDLWSEDLTLGDV